MTVKIKYGKFRLAFWLPTGFTGGICLSIAKREGEKHGVNIKESRKLKREIRRAVKTAKKTFGKFVLVDVKSNDGVIVKITV